MTDWNPDKEAHVKHKWIVHKGVTDPEIKGVETGKGFMKFNDEGRFMVSDEAIASEIRSGELGKAEICVTRVRYPDPADRGHRYFFGGWPEMPWKKKKKEEEEKDADN